MSLFFVCHFLSSFVYMQVCLQVLCFVYACTCCSVCLDIRYFVCICLCLFVLSCLLLSQIIICLFLCPIANSFNSLLFFQYFWIGSWVNLFVCLTVYHFVCLCVNWFVNSSPVSVFLCARVCVCELIVCIIFSFVYLFVCLSVIFLVFFASVFVNRTFVVYLLLIFFLCFCFRFWSFSYSTKGGEKANYDNLGKEDNAEEELTKIIILILSLYQCFVITIILIAMIILVMIIMIIVWIVVFIWIRKTM